LRSKSVQEAQQVLTTILFLPPMIAGFVGFALAGRLKGPASSADGGLIVLIALAVIAALCVLFIWLAMRRFRRDRLVSD
jgi:predicted permease